MNLLKQLRAFVMFGLALPAWAQYAGPAILSRGEAPAAMSTPTVDFAFSVALTANYSRGLLGVTTNSEGQLLNQSSYGGGLTEKPVLIGLNKADAMTPREAAARRVALQKASGRPVMLLSGVSGQGVPEVLRRLQSMIDDARREQAA